MSKLSVHVRAARPEDAPVIADFNAALAHETERIALHRATLDAGVREALRDPAKCSYFVAELDDGRVVGQLMITREWSDWRNGDIWWIQSVYVHADFRRRGVFRSLYDHARSAAGAAGAVALRLYVDADNTTGQQTYLGLGMRRTNYLVMEDALQPGPVG